MLDDDVASMLRRAQQDRKGRLKEIVNEGLREGLSKMLAQKPKRRPFRIKPMNLGRCRLENIDDVSEVLALVEGETFRDVD
jgi:hypothetical protein